MNDREQYVRMRAYEIWEREGRRDGQADDHWRQAEAEVERELSQKASADEQPNASTRMGATLEPKKARSGASGPEKVVKSPRRSQSGKEPSAAKEMRARSGSSRGKAGQASLRQAAPA